MLRSSKALKCAVIISIFFFDHVPFYAERIKIFENIIKIPVRALCDEEYSTIICVNHRFSDPKTWPLAVDYTVELTSQSIDKWRNQDRDTLANQNPSDTNMQSRMSTESHIAVPFDVRACSSFKKWEPSERRVTSIFVSIFSNISCGYVVNNMSTADERGVPHTPTCDDFQKP